MPERLTLLDAHVISYMSTQPHPRSLIETAIQAVLDRQEPEAREETIAEIRGHVARLVLTGQFRFDQGEAISQALDDVA